MGTPQSRDDEAFYARMFSRFLAWEQTTHDTIDFKKTYVDMAGDILAGLALSEIVYWHLPNKKGESRLRVHKKGHEWIACARHEWWDRTRMTPRQVDTALKNLIDAGLIFKGKFVFNGAPTTHVRINFKGFFTLWNSLMNDPLENPFTPNSEQKSDFEGASNKDVKSISPFGEIQFDVLVKSITETTSETTTERKEKEIPAPIVAVTPEPVETDTVKESPPALPESTGKVLAFTPATETDEDTPRRERKPNKNAPIHDALIAAFNLTGIKMNPKADKMYWAVAAELSDFPVDRVAELYSYVRRKSQAERWNTFTVNALAKYAPDFLRDHPHKITYIVDDSALPKAAGAEGDAIPITADKRAEAERMMADLVAKMNGNGVKRASGQ